MVESDSVHVCTLKKETTKEENSRLHSLSLSSSSSLTCLVDHNLFNLTWKTNLCGVANAQQRDKQVTDIYSMATLWNYSGKNWKPLHSTTRMTLRTRFLGGILTSLHFFFSPKKLAQLFLLKESPDRKMKKTSNI